MARSVKRPAKTLAPGKSASRAVNPPVPRKDGRVAGSSDYRAKAATLRKLGYHPSYGRPGGSLPHRKAAMTRRLNALAPYLPDAKGKTRFRFVRASKAQREAVGVKKNTTPGGVFVQIPRGVEPKNFTARITKRGTLSITTRTPRKGRGKKPVVRRDEIVKLEADKVAGDAGAAIAAAVAAVTGKDGKQPAHVQLMVNGHEGRDTYDPKQAKRYLVKFKRDTMAGIRKGHTSKEGMSEEEFNDTFQVKMIFDEADEADEEEMQDIPDDFDPSDEEDFGDYSEGDDE